MKQFKGRDIWILGFMYFALFVGAGNIIFPPIIGMQAGTAVIPAALGFLVTAVGLPVITSVAMARANGAMAAITAPMGKTGGILLTLVCYLCIGPFFGIPRTASVSYDLAVQPFTHSENSLWVWSLAYFAIVILVSFYPGKLMDSVGKILAPLKIIALAILGITAFVVAAGKPSFPKGTWQVAPFSEGITNGYVTMDTLAALAFGLVIVNAIRSRGVDSPRLITRYALLASLIAGGGLILVYVSLFRLGTVSASLAPNANNGAEVLSAYVHYSFGIAGTLFLGILLTIACLITAIGLTSACAAYLSHLTGKPNALFACIIALFSLVVANLGLTTLLTISVPILTAIYPMFIVLIGTYFIRHRFSSDALVVMPVALLALFFGIADGLHSANLTVQPFSLARYCPLYSQNLAWLLPSCVLFVLLFMIDRIRSPKERYSQS